MAVGINFKGSITMVLELDNTKRLAAELGAVKTYGHFINGQWLDGDRKSVV